MNVIESVVYCAAGLILLGLGAAHTNYVATRSHSIEHNIALYVSHVPFFDISCASFFDALELLS